MHLLGDRSPSLINGNVTAEPVQKFLLCIIVLGACTVYRGKVPSIWYVCCSRQGTIVCLRLFFLLEENSASYSGVIIVFNLAA